MTNSNVPLFFGALIGGAVILDYGVKNMRATFANATATSPDPTGGPSPAGAPASKDLHTNLITIGSGHGWNGSEVSAWEGVINIEDSAHSLTAKNPQSNAYGFAQFINGPDEYAQYGGDVNTLTGQLTAMANYIKQRYGTPSAALQHEHMFGWY